MLAIAFLLLIGANGLRLGSKTPYPHPINQNYSNPYLNQQNSLENCEIRRVQLVGRHGARFPTLKSIRSINAFINHVNHFRDLLRNDSRLSWLTKLQPVNEENAGLLTAIGEQDWIRIGQRMKTRYQKLFSKYSPAKHAFQSSDRSRAGQSASALAKGIFGNVSAFLTTLPRKMDNLVSYASSCFRYKNSTQIIEPIESYKSTILPTILDHLKKEYRQNAFVRSLQNNDVLSLYTICQFSSPHYEPCSLFTQRQLESLEYMDDLDVYYRHGHGRAGSNMIACHLLKSLFDEKVSFSAKLGHVSTMMPLFTLLEMYAPFKNESSKEKSSGMPFEAFKFVPFSSHLTIETYTCSETRFDESSGQTIFENNHYIRFLLNERVITVPRCQADVCQLSRFRELWKEKFTCEWEKWCRVSSQCFRH